MIGLAGNTGAGSGDGAAPPEAVTVKGSVLVLGPVSDALVCIDRNLNNSCDDDEPKAARTGTDGAYAFTYTPASADVAADLLAAPLLAEVAGANASLPAFTAAFKMAAPAGSRSQINPLTTIIQAGVAGGLTREQSETAASLQLGLPVAQFYDYQDVPPGDLLAIYDDDAWTMTAIAADSLHEAARQGLADQIRVVDPSRVEPVATDQLAQLTFTDPGNYFAQHYPTNGVVDATTGRLQLTDVREGRTGGSPTSRNVLFPQVRLGPAGWVRCDDTASFTSTLGLPSRSYYCGDSTRSVGYAFIKDVSGQRMADVLQDIRFGEGNSLGTLNPATALANPDATFPPGSQVRHRKGVDVTQPFVINLLNDATGFATIESFIAGSPASSVDLATGAGTRNLGLYSDTSLVRFAATSGDGVQYYRCDGAPPNFSPLSNCVAIGTGTWRLTSGLPSGVRMIEFSNVPQPTPAVRTTIRYYGEFEGQVYTVRRNRPEAQFNISVSQRLNGPAWESLKTQLGVVSP